jgi:hypothetical protein
MKLLGTLSVVLVILSPANAGAQLFDFDTAPVHSPLPISLTVAGVTATFIGTGQGFSIQEAGVLGFTPVGFAGNCIYPSSVFLADLQVSFSVPLSYFSIMFAPEEYGCDTTATMRVTAYMDGVNVGTNTANAPQPGTWPTGVLTYSNAQGFNSVVVHYDAQPVIACDWGPVFMADNMEVATLPTPVAPKTWGHMKYLFLAARQGPGAE